MRGLLIIAAWSLIIRLSLAAFLRINVPAPLWLLSWCGLRWFATTRAGGRLAWWLWRRWAMWLKFKWGWQRWPRFPKRRIGYK